MRRHLAVNPKLTKTTRVQSVPSALINHRIFRFKGPKTSTKFSAFLPFPPINYTNYSREIGRKVRGRTYSFTRLKFSPLAVDVCSCTSHAAVCVSSFFFETSPGFVRRAPNSRFGVSFRGDTMHRDRESLSN